MTKKTVDKYLRLTGILRADFVYQITLNKTGGLHHAGGQPTEVFQQGIPAGLHIKILYLFRFKTIFNF